jgi:hypothetical protein
MAPKKKRHLEVAPNLAVSVTPADPLGEGEEPTELDIESPVAVMAESPVPGQIPIVEPDVEGILREPEPAHMVEIRNRLLSIPNGLYTFGEALVQLVNNGNARARREVWPNNGAYLTISANTLSIVVPPHTPSPFHVDVADIVAQDWIVMHFPL